MSEYPKYIPDNELTNVIKRWDFRHEQGWSEDKSPEPRLLEFVEKFREEIGPKILDIGTGGGRHLVPLAELGYQVTGIDASKVGLEQIKKQLPNADVVQADFRKLPFADGSFDTAVAIQALHNGRKESRAEAFREAARILKPGGLFFFRVNSITNLTQEGAVELPGEKETWLREKDESGASVIVHRFSLEEIQKLADENGFDLVGSPVDEKVKPDGSTELGQWNVVFRKKII
ncbi:MAG: class I SAM-dependent methyltransferase [Candidatus Doudnabacteria bacterium]|nr:class I SAM-dependent methyltransferase [Candidatus Doudnabacteria bacterium]